MEHEKNSFFNLRTMTSIAIMAALISVIAPFSIPLPFTLVPVTFANLVIFLSLLLLGMKAGTFSVVVYLLIGLVGLPVFSGFTGGISMLAGPTGGYLIGYIFMALICGIFVDKFKNSRAMFCLGMILGMFALYLLGTLWLAFQANLSFNAALFAGVIPFIPGDIAKIIIVLILGPILQKGLNRSGLLLHE